MWRRDVVPQDSSAIRQSYSPSLQIREDNVEACASLLTRIAEIARDLANHPVESPEPAPRIDRLKRRVHSRVSGQD